MTLAFLLTVLVATEVVISLVIGGGVALSRRAYGLALFLSVALPCVGLGALIGSWSSAYALHGFNAWAWGFGFATGGSLGAVVGDLLTTRIKEACRACLLRRRPYEKRWPPPLGAA